MLVSIAEADTYFDTRLGASEYWVSGTAKAAALQTAENDLVAVYGAVSNKIAVCEQALFRLADLALDRRAAIQAQGVAAAGMYKESYRTGGGGIPICPYAREALGDPKSVLNVHNMELEDDIVSYEL